MRGKCTEWMIAGGAALLLAVAVSAPAAADQQDPRLNKLFHELKTTKDASRGRELTRRIWEIWFVAPNARLNMMIINGNALMHRRRLGEAIAQYSAVIREAPNFAEAWNRRAVARFLARDFDGSLKDITRTLALEPRHFGALAGMGAIYAHRKQYRNALAAYRRALDVNPHQPLIRRRIGQLEERLRNRDI